MGWSPANSTSTATFPPRSRPKTAIWCSIAPRWWGKSWKIPADESREGNGTGPGDRAGMAEFRSVEFSAAARARGAGGFLGLYLRQLHPHATLRAGLARTLPRQGIDGDRRAHAGVHFCTIRIERGARHSGVWADLSRSGRQQPGNLEVVCLPLLADKISAR